MEYFGVFSVTRMKPSATGFGHSAKFGISLIPCRYTDFYLCKQLVTLQNVHNVQNMHLGGAAESCDSADNRVAEQGGRRRRCKVWNVR